MTALNAPRSGRPPVIVLAAVTVAVLALALGALAFTAKDDVGAPAWQGNAQECREEPMEHVHHPTRLDLLVRCATVSGTVRSVDLDTSFNDLKIVIEPEQRYLRYLLPANAGELIVDVIATDLLRVPVPEPGSRITASGAWVVDRAKDTVALHPAYRIDIVEGRERPGGIPDRSEPRQDRGQLAVEVETPESITIGERMDVTVRSFWTDQGRRVPASTIHVFAELTTSDGTGVWWGAARTNSLGVSTMWLLALHVPGHYRLTVYATPSGSAEVATAEIDVTRR